MVVVSDLMQPSLVCEVPYPNMLRSHGLNGLQHSHMHITVLCLKQQDFLLSSSCLEEFQKSLLM